MANTAAAAAANMNFAYNVCPNQMRSDNEKSHPDKFTMLNKRRIGFVNNSIMERMTADIRVLQMAFIARVNCMHIYYT